MSEPEDATASNIRPLLDRLKQAKIGVTSAYKQINAGNLRVVKLGKRTYVRDEDWAAFIASLPAYSPKTKHKAK